MNEKNQKLFDAYVTLDFLYWNIVRMHAKCSEIEKEIDNRFSDICIAMISVQDALKSVLALDGIRIETETDDGPTRIHAYDKNENELDVAEEGIDDYRW